MKKTQNSKKSTATLDKSGKYNYIGRLWPALSHFSPKVRDLWLTEVENDQKKKTWMWWSEAIDYLDRGQPAGVVGSPLCEGGEIGAVGAGEITPAATPWEAASARAFCGGRLTVRPHSGQRSPGLWARRS